MSKMKVSIERDVEGYLFNPDDWIKEIAVEIANEEGIELNESHWQIIHFVRRFYEENRIAPDVRHVMKFLMDEKNLQKKDAKKQIFSLFPYGYVKQACKISGMIKPRVWSTG